ncbi:MAG: hypothetical protein HC848_07805 [Limnobacter sp.]|nr:hypothetical protein [Limnobacter sp.]
MDAQRYLGHVNAQQDALNAFSITQSLGLSGTNTANTAMGYLNSAKKFLDATTGALNISKEVHGTLTVDQSVYCINVADVLLRDARVNIEQYNQAIKPVCDKAPGRTVPRSPAQPSGTRQAVARFPCATAPLESAAAPQLMRFFLQ